MKLNNYFKILLILFFSFLVSSFSINNIFLANSPKIKPNLGSYFLAKINNVRDNILAKINFNFLSPTNTFITDQNKNKNKNIEFLKNNLKPITKGVNAAVKDSYSYTEFKINEIEWVKISYSLKDGRVINIEYPKGTNPPPKEIYEN